MMLEKDWPVGLSRKPEPVHPYVMTDWLQFDAIITRVVLKIIINNGVTAVTYPVTPLFINDITLIEHSAFSDLVYNKCKKTFSYIMYYSVLSTQTLPITSTSIV